MARRRSSGRGRRPRRWAGRLLGAGAVALLAFAAWQAWTWPDVAGLRTRPPVTTAFIERYRAAERAAGRSGQVARTWVPYGQISPHLKRAVLVAEDINFFSHRGFDFGQVREALVEAMDEGELPRGASTISQQLVKNLWLTPSRNPWRKVKEALLTWHLERRLGKRRILELYLNVVEFGPGTYGAEAAARRYFARPAADLDAGEAARLAAGLPSPRTWHPGSSARGYERHVARVLRRMERAEFLWRQI